MGPLCQEQPETKHTRKQGTGQRRRVVATTPLTLLSQVTLYKEEAEEKHPKKQRNLETLKSYGNNTTLKKVAVICLGGIKEELDNFVAYHVRNKT